MAMPFSHVGFVCDFILFFARANSSSTRAFLSLRAIQPKIQFRRAPQPQTFHQFMPDIFFGGEQALETALGFLIVAIDIHENLRRAAIVGHMYRSHAHQADARIRQFSFDQRLDLFAQSLAQPPPMIFEPALLHSLTYLEVKRMRISENRPRVLAPWCHCRAQTWRSVKYRGNNPIAACYAPSVFSRHPSAADCARL